MQARNSGPHPPNQVRRPLGHLGAGCGRPGPSAVPRRSETPGPRDPESSRRLGKPPLPGVAKRETRSRLVPLPVPLPRAPGHFLSLFLPSLLPHILHPGPGTVTQASNCSLSSDAQLLIVPPIHQGDRDTNNLSGSKNMLPESAASASLWELVKNANAQAPTSDLLKQTVELSRGLCCSQSLRAADLNVHSFIHSSPHCAAPPVEAPHPSINALPADRREDVV